MESRVHHHSASSASSNASSSPPSGSVAIDLKPIRDGVEAEDDERLKHSPARPQLKILCFDLSNFPRPGQLLFLSTGVFFFFMANGFLEEYTFGFLPNFKYGWFLTLFELMCFAIFAVLERASNGERVVAHNAPLQQHCLIAVAMTAARGLTNVSLQYLNYPTQVIFKSMKLVTVMIASVFWLRKSYTLTEYLSAFLLVSAAIFFSLGDFSAADKADANLPATLAAGSADYTGIIIVLVSLVADALHSSVQESVLQHHKATILETMFFSNLFSASLCFIYLLLTGEFLHAIAYCAEYPVAYLIFVVRAFVIYCGVLCFASLIKHFDVVVATSITTIRKILTVLASFMLFPKPFSMNYVYGALAFFASLALSIQDAKSRRK